MHLPPSASSVASISANEDIARLAAVSTPFLPFVFVTMEKVAVETSHVFHLLTRAHALFHRGQNLTPDRPSQHNRLRGVVVYQLGAYVALPALHWTLLSFTRIFGATIIASGKQRLFQLRPTSPNTMFGGTYQRVGA